MVSAENVPRDWELGPWLDLTMPIDWQWMPDQVYADSVQVRVAGAGDPLKGLRLGGESGTCIVLPSMFAPHRKTTTIHELDIADLTMRVVAILRVPSDSESGISGDDVRDALRAFNPDDVDGVMLVSGHGDDMDSHRGNDTYVLESPFLRADAVAPLAEFLSGKPFKLLMTDLAILGRPDKHMLSEWCSPRPAPSCYPSEQAIGYLRGYRAVEYFEDFSVDLALASEGIAVVKKLLAAGNLRGDHAMVCVAPLNCVRVKSAPCRVVAAGFGEDGFDDYS
jgi:kynurenine formamidase